MSSSLVHDPKNNTKEKAVANDNKNFFILVFLHLLEKHPFYLLGIPFEYFLDFSDVFQILFLMDFYLCENNVMERIELFHEEAGVEIDGTSFFRYNGFDLETLDFVAYNKATASWQSDYYGTPMSEADAKAILARYSRVDQGMQPISQLLNG